MKNCKDCHKIKPLSEFYIHPGMKDGHLNKCKECTKSHVKKNREDNIDYYREFDRNRGNLPHRVEARRNYGKTEAGKAALNRGKSAYIKRNPIKTAARYAVNNAIRDGKMKKGPCEVCGTTEGIHGHHDDYSKPLSVRWLCHRHHRAEHKS